MPRRRGPLLLLEGATLLSGAGNGIASVALPWLILERSGSAVAAGIVAAATALPLLFSSLFSGTLVDRFGRRRMAIGSDLLSGLAVAAIPIVDGAGGLSVPVLVALAVLGAVFDPAGITARETMLPAAATTAGVSLDRANGIHEAIWGMAFLIGPGVGGVMIAAVGAVNTLWLTALGFVLSAALLVAVRLAGAATSVDAPAPSGIWRSTMEGLAFVWRERTLRAVGLLSMGIVALYMPVEGVILPVHFQALETPERLGIVIMTMSGGMALGSLAYGWLSHHTRRFPLFAGALIGSSLALLGMAFLPGFGVIVVFSLATGFLYGPVQPITNYAMQTRTPEHLRGRVVGVMTSLAYAAGPLGYLLTGPLVDTLGVRPAFLLLATALAVFALTALPSRALRALDDAPPHPPGPDPGHEIPTLPGVAAVPAATVDTSTVRREPVHT